MAGLTQATDPNLLVGIETGDDAAVYRLNDEQALISTVDFITPPVDDPWWFGQIAAANSLSDVYAMGGRPTLALNIVMFPSGDLDMGLLRDILRGGQEKVLEAGAVLGGGHSIMDAEPKYGLCVNGLVHPDRIMTNAGVRPGDVLLLTKPLGSGVIFNAVRSGKLPYAEAERDVLPLVASLNRKAMETALKFDLHACTDVTGFGLAVHALEMAVGSRCRLVLRQEALPIYPHALDMYERGETTGSNKDNRKAAKSHVHIRVSLGKAREEILFDPQTSGGLLLSVRDNHADALVGELKTAGVAHASRIGYAEAGPAEVVIE